MDGSGEFSYSTGIRGRHWAGGAMDRSDDELLFADGGGEEAEAALLGPPWRMLVVDDDDQVRRMTEFVLGRLVFRNRPLRIDNAASGAEAKAILARDGAVYALVLLDVVMETEDAGLRLVRVIREELGLHALRIILRTGQPGRAPENDVIFAYDINDYRDKTELTADRLRAAVVAALRGFDDIVTIEAHRTGLRRIIDGSCRLDEGGTPGAFAATALQEIHRLLAREGREDPAAAPSQTSAPAPSQGLVALRQRGADGTVRLDMLASSGLPPGALPSDIRRLLDAAGDRRAHVFEESAGALFLEAARVHEILVWIAAPEPLTERDRDLLAVFATKLASAFGNVMLYSQLRAHADRLEEQVAERTRALQEANRRLEHIAGTDPLTGLANRRRILDLLGAEIDRSMRLAHVLSVLIFDLDSFKQINDRYGHAGGDATLRATADRVMTILRPYDAVGRLGGEEFLVVLPETGLDDALAIAERLRQAIADSPVPHQGREIRVTASFGCALRTGREEGVDALIHRADIALYRAKNGGRNRVEVADPA
ncbi:MAG: hypothetical protein RLY86_1384 [Pseudomonadota bacterium]|jgi:diguanylate cyclase (GGDEF)-like protein